MIYSTLNNMSKKADKIAYCKKYLPEELVTLVFDQFVTFGFRVSAALKKEYLSYSYAKTDSFLSPGDEAEFALKLLKHCFLGDMSKSEAKAYISEAMKLLNPDEREFIIEVINRSIAPGLSAKSLTDAFPSAIRLYSVQKPVTCKVDEVRLPTIASLKIDGFRAQIFVSDEVFMIRTANGLTLRDYHVFEKRVREQVKNISNTVTMIDCEAFDGVSFNSTSSLIGNTSKDISSLFFMPFNFVVLEPGVDFITEDTKSAWNMNEQTQWTMMPEWIEYGDLFKKVYTRLIGSQIELKAFFDDVVKAGGEGLVCKNPSSYWTPKRTKHWQRLKIEDTLDLEIVDVTDGTGKYTGQIGALVVGLNGCRVHVGTGLNDEFRSTYKKEDLIGRIVEVKFMERTEESLRLPRFVCFRDDEKLKGVKR